MKTAYICGPLTELPEDIKEPAKALYSLLGDICEEELGIRAFVPHEHFDPEIHSHFTAQEVDKAERSQVCHRTSILIVVALEPTWGGGIEVEMANCNGVPVLILKPKKRISRLLLGNPAIKDVREFSTFDSAAEQLHRALREFKMKKLMKPDIPGESVVSICHKQAADGKIRTVLD